MSDLRRKTSTITHRNLMERKRLNKVGVAVLIGTIVFISSNILYALVLDGFSVKSVLISLALTMLLTLNSIRLVFNKRKSYRKRC